MRDSGSLGGERITLPPDTAMAHVIDGAEPTAGACI